MPLFGILLLFGVSTTSAFSFSDLFDRHVFGGSTSMTDKLYQVSLAKNGDHFCGGAVISDRYVVSAAHCFNGTREDWKGIQVRAGSLNRKNGTLYQLNETSVTRMDCYNDITYDCDIAVFKIKSNFSKEISKIKLVDEEPKDDTVLTIFGWGLVGESSELPENLQNAAIKKIKLLTCQRQYDNVKSMITENMICAGDGNKNICQGDSGGPLVYKQKGEERLVGIASFGDQKPCSKFAGVFTNVASKKVQDFLKKFVQ